MTEFMQFVHAQIKEIIEHSNANYKAATDIHRRRLIFKEGDLIWVILTKERCPYDSYSKLGARKVYPWKVLIKINDNAYTIQLPSHLNISNAFNVKHLKPYFPIETWGKLVVNNACIGRRLKYLPNRIRLLDWPNYPFSFPSNFCPQELVYLNIQGSNIQMEKLFKQVWLLLLLC